MGKLLERNTEIARRCGDLTPLREPVRQRLIAGNLAVVLAGVSPGTTRPVKPLGAWAGPPPGYPKRKGPGPPRAPMGAASRVVTMYEVNITAGVGQLKFIAGWPGFSPVIEYLDRGTRGSRAVPGTYGRTARPKGKGMPARPIFGFRPIDLEWVGLQLRAYVTAPTVGQRVGGWFKGLFGGQA